MRVRCLQPTKMHLLHCDIVLGRQKLHTCFPLRSQAVTLLFRNGLARAADKNVRRQLVVRSIVAFFWPDFSQE